MDYSLIERYISKLLSEPSPDKPVWNIERAKSGAAPHWNYIDGCFLLAIWALYEQTADERYAKFCDAFMDFYIAEDGVPLGYKLTDFNLDNICAGRLLFDLRKYSARGKYTKAIDLLFSQLEQQPRTREGNFWHKAVYPNQVWLDGLYMAQVFYVRYALENAKQDLLDDSLWQFTSVREKMRDIKTGLYRHGYDAERKIFWADKATGQSPNVWLRSLGWFVMSLTDICGYLQDGEQKNILRDMLLNLLTALKKYADPATGMYYQVTDQGPRKGNYLESSGSSMIALAMMKAARLGLADASFRDVGVKTFEGVCREYLRETEDGLTLGGICLSAGLGPEDNTKRDGSYEYYLSEPVVRNDAKGVAPFLMCYAELKANEQ